MLGGTSGQLEQLLKKYLGGQGDLLRRLIALVNDIITPIIPMRNLLNKSP